MEMANCIFWDNEASNCSGIYVSGSASLAVTYSDVEGGQPAPECVTVGSTVDWGPGNIDCDPRFADAGSGEYHLSCGSCCIDAGTNDTPSLPPTDLDGNDRIVDGDFDDVATVDMGAYEFQGDTTPPEITCPEDVTLECPACTTPECTGWATATDACCGENLTITYVDDVVPGCCETKTITRTWTATDGCGLSSSCVQIIKVVDTTPPECDAAPDEIAACEGTAVTLTYSVTDNCDPDPECCWYEGDQLLVCGSPLVHTFELGKHTITLRCTDDCGNTCEDTVTVTIGAELAVTSDPPGVEITDDQQVVQGVTPYSACYEPGKTVRLCAQDRKEVDDVWYRFRRWEIDGVSQEERLTCIAVEMDKAHAAKAVYEIVPWTLSVESFPIAGAGITGDKPGTTNYVEWCWDGEVVNLLAPPTMPIEGRCYHFMYWMVDGQIGQKNSVALRLEMDSNKTAIAVYDPWPPGDLDGNCTVNVLDLIKVRNNLGKKCSPCAP